MSNLTQRRRSPALAAAGVTAALFLLSACGGSGGDGEGGGTAAKDTGKDKNAGVASITSPSASGAAASASAAAEAGRPQLRIDTTDAEHDRLFGIWFTCLHDHGVPTAHKPGATGWFPAADTSKYPAALKACLSKKPIQPPEEDPAKNPHYLDDFRKDITCLNAGGLKVKGLSDGSGWNYDGDSHLTQAQEDTLQRKCKLEAYQ